MQNVILWYLFLPLLLFCRSGAAQPPASQEAHHKVVFENEYVRILDGHVPAHDTTPAHVHSANGVVVFLSASPLAIQVLGGQPVLSMVHPGDMRYVNYGDKPVTHVVWTDGPGELHFLVVELKREGTGDRCEKMQGQGLQFQWEQKGVRAYEVDATRGAVKLPGSGCGYFLIGVSGKMEARALAGKRELGVGGFGFFPAGEGFVITGSGRGVLLELE